MYNICISIICVQFLRGTGHLVEKEKTSHYVWGVTQTTAGRVQGRGEQDHTEGQRLGVSVVQIDLQGEHL